MDLRKMKVYIISVGVGKYKKRLQNTIQRLTEHGFENMEHVPSIPDPNPTNSLSLTNLYIFEKEQDKTDPFLVVEDDIQLVVEETSNNKFVITIPPNTSAIYLGVSSWVYPYDYGSLTHNRQHIRSLMEDDVCLYNDNLVEIKGMTSAHAILYIDRTFLKIMSASIREHLSLQTPHDLILATYQQHFKIYALKNPLFYQDGTEGGQEDVTRLVWKNNQYKRKLE